MSPPFRHQDPRSPAHVVPLALACALAVAAALLTMPTIPAQAGEYQVVACDAAPGGANNSWIGVITHFRMRAGGACPSEGSPRRGLSVSHVPSLDPEDRVPNGAAASLSFRPPPGATITGVAAHWSRHHYNCEWIVGLSYGGGYLFGGAGPCGGSAGDETRAGFFPLPHAQVLSLESFCGAASCQLLGYPPPSWNDPNGVYLHSVRVVVNDTTTPTLTAPHDQLWADGWHRGRENVAFHAEDNVGIKLNRAYGDGRVLASADRACDYTLRAPCPNGGATLPVDTPELSDGPHTLTVATTDTADNQNNLSRRIYVDNHAPGQPEDLQLAGGDGWRSANAFRVTWTNPRQGAASPIAGAEYRLCPSRNRSDDETGCVYGDRAGTGIDHIDDLRVPSAGEWTMRLWLRDAAGNRDRNAAAAPVRLRVDQEAPSLALQPQDAEDPARIRVKARDALSGISKGEIEVRRRGDRTWIPLSPEVGPDGFSGVLDDETLPDGIYDLRARAVDGAGNERSTDKLPDGKPATLQLPVRIKTRLAVGKVKRVRAKRSRHGKPLYRRILIGNPRTRYGRTVRLSGRLTTPGANPVVGAPVEVFERVDLTGAEFQRVATITTSRTGRFVFKALRGPSRIVRFRYAGTKTVRSRTTDIELRVRAGTTFRVNHRHVVNGEEVTFRGRLQGGPLPVKSKLVQVQVYSRRRWTTFGLARANPTSGLWSHRYRFEATRGRVRYRFRARVPREAGYPYDTGASRSLRVSVRGL